MIACFETRDFRIELARALLIRGKKPGMPKTDSPQALSEQRFSWVLSALKSFGVLNPAWTPRLLSVLYVQQQPGDPVPLLARCQLQV